MAVLIREEASMAEFKPFNRLLVQPALSRLGSTVTLDSSRV